MTENFILGRNNKLEHELKALADYINIPYSILQPYQSECFVRHYTKGQVIYFSPQESSNIYFLIEGNIIREHYNQNGDVYRYFNKEQVLFPISNLFHQKEVNELCTALTDCTVLGLPRELMAFLCKANDDIFLTLFALINDNEQQHMNYNMALTSKFAKDRIIKLLCHLCQTVGYDQDEFYEIKQFLTIQLMSDMAGISRETAGHIIHELKDEKLVVKDHKNWLVSKHLFNDVCV